MAEKGRGGAGWLSKLKRDYDDDDMIAGSKSNGMGRLDGSMGGVHCYVVVIDLDAS